MSSFPLRAAAALLAAVAFSAVAQQTVCTVTVNSPDERDVLQRQLPADRYRFVELVAPGRPDWFRDACQAQVSCDVLVVSGHFAGVEFYSSKPAATQTMRVDDMERALCSGECGNVFANLKEVYLFGCDTLKPEPIRHGETTRDLMRRLFANVPVIYGFSSLAPLGRHAGPMLEGLMRGDAALDFGTARPNNKLLSVFGPSSMVMTSGMGASGEQAAICPLYDERRELGERVATWHGILAGPADDVRRRFGRAEAFFADLDRGAAPGASARLALDAIAADGAARERFLALARGTRDPALRLRMVAFAARIRWLAAAEERDERLALARDLVNDRAIDYGEVDLVCGLNRDGGLDARLPMAGLAAMTAPQAAALACLGDRGAHDRVLRAIASEDEREVRAAQAYLRHRPLAEAEPLQRVAASIARMKAGPAQVRALETLARQSAIDGAVAGELLALYARTRSSQVQGAIAEIFLRHGASLLDARGAATLRTHRLRDGGGGVIDAVLGRAAAS